MPGDDGQTPDVTALMATLSLASTTSCNGMTTAPLKAWPHPSTLPALALRSAHGTTCLGLVAPRPQDSNGDLRLLGPFQKVGNVVERLAQGVHAIHLKDLGARTNASPAGTSA